jgi:hypothetical protein
MPKYNIANGSLVLKRKSHDGFKRGGKGVYKCGSCGINTRRTDENSHTDSETCADCFELAGIYNSYQDNGAEGVRDFRNEIISRCNNILKKGGKLDSDNQTLLDIANETPKFVAPMEINTAEMDKALHSLAQEAATKSAVSPVLFMQSATINGVLAMMKQSFEETTQRDCSNANLETLRAALVKFYGAE